MPPAELMKTQTDRKIAEELQRTYDVQREAQIKRQDLERETAVANMQAEVVRSEQEVRIAERRAMAVAESAKGEASAVRLRADAEADATRAVGGAKADAYRQGVAALGTGEYVTLQLTTTLAEHQIKIVPDIAVASGGSSVGLGEALLGRLLLRPATAAAVVAAGSDGKGAS